MIDLQRIGQWPTPQSSKTGFMVENFNTYIPVRTHTYVNL